METVLWGLPVLYICNWYRTAVPKQRRKTYSPDEDTWGQCDQRLGGEVVTEER